MLHQPTCHYQASKELSKKDGKLSTFEKMAHARYSNLGGRIASLFRKATETIGLSRNGYTIFRNHSLKNCDVSVCISLYNYGRYIRTAVESVMQNQGPLVEIVIVNDCSTDESLSIARSFLQSNHHVTLIDKHSNTGLIDTRNIGIHHCVGEKVFILDADNQIYEDCLSSHLAMLRAHPNMVACYASIECFDESGALVRKVSNRKFDYEALKKANFIDAMAMFDRNRLIALGCYNSKMARVGIGWEGYELWLRIGSLGLEVGFIEQTMSRYLVKTDSMIKKTNRLHAHALKKYLNKKYDADIQ